VEGRKSRRDKEIVKQMQKMKKKMILIANRKVHRELLRKMELVGILFKRISMLHGKMN